MLNILRNLDRRWIFLAMFLTVAVPVLLQTTYPEGLTPTVRNAFDLVESLPPGSNVMLAMDYDAPSAAELAPMSMAFARHACLQGHNLFFITLWPNGNVMVSEVIDKVVAGEFADKYTYGKNYVDLGFRSGNEMVINVIATDLRAQFKTDSRNNALESMDVTRNIKSLADMDLILSVSGGTPGAKEWIQYAATRLRIPMAAGGTGVQSTQLYSYYPLQLPGLLPGIKGAAEYEDLLGKKDKRYANPELATAMQKMAPQLWGHLLLILLIILGNIVYFADRKRKGGTR